jgi:hypothetical protein
MARGVLALPQDGERSGYPVASASWVRVEHCMRWTTRTPAPELLRLRRRRDGISRAVVTHHEPHYPGPVVDTIPEQGPPEAPVLVVSLENLNWVS